MNKYFYIIASVLFLFAGCKGNKPVNNEIITINRKVKISIFNKYCISAIMIEAEQGTYVIRADNREVYTLKQNDAIHIISEGDSICLRSVNEYLGLFGEVEINDIPDTLNADCSNILYIKPLLPDIKARSYDDNLIVHSIKKRLRLLNHVDINKYLAGVAETEGGPNAPFEYYKAQVILCRTYLFNHFNRHKDEGFSLCDGVHCQAYKHRSMYNDSILPAAVATDDMVVVDSSNELINAVYHANSGGQTVNSEDVWPAPKSCLKSVNDPYSAVQRQAVWTKKIPVYCWIQYLRANNFSISTATPASRFAFYQQKRKVYYTFGGKSVLLQKIRHDWNLKSTFFSIIPNGNNLIFKGKGYGHGVGLSQEGAMQMAKQGFSYQKMIDFYFYNITIKKYDEILGNPLHQNNSETAEIN